MLRFSIPDSYYLLPVNIKLLRMIKEHSDYFYNDFEITSAYGCPEGCIWNGGRVNFGQYSLEEIQHMLRKYKENGLSYRFTFTNNLVKKVHLKDHYSNIIASNGNIEGNSVIVNLKLIKHYISREYKRYNFVQSVTTMLDNIKKINKLSKNSIVVLPIKFNNNFDFLAKIKNPRNIEIMVNEMCIENCPYRRKHYEMINKRNLLLRSEKWICPNRLNTPESIKGRKHYVGRDKIKLYENMGITNFKISGRESVEYAIWSYCEMFVKEEFKETVKKELQTLTNLDWNWEEIK